MENINKKIETFRQYLISDEKSDNTVEKYIRDVRAFREWCERNVGDGIKFSACSPCISL